MITWYTQIAHTEEILLLYCMRKSVYSLFIEIHGPAHKVSRLSGHLNPTVLTFFLSEFHVDTFFALKVELDTVQDQPYM